MIHGMYYKLKFNQVCFGIISVIRIHIVSSAILIKSEIGLL